MQYLTSIIWNIFLLVRMSGLFMHLLMIQIWFNFHPLNPELAGLASFNLETFSQLKVGTKAHVCVHLIKLCCTSVFSYPR